MAQRRAATATSRRKASDTTPPGLPIHFSLLSSDDSVLVDPRTVDVEPRQLKTSEVVAQRVVADIVRDKLQIGDRLPGESEMLEQYDVSRESLREGLRLLETQGFLTIRRGPGGGPVVAAVDPRNLARMSTLYFHLAGANYEELFDTWLLLEPLVVRQVAETVDRATKRKALAPFLPHADVTDREEFMSTSNGFHAVLANLSGNKVLTLVLQAITHVVVEHIVRDLDPLNERDEIGHDHEDIGQAVLDGKGATAQRLMAEHIGHIIEFYRTQFPSAVQELIAWR